MTKSQPSKGSTRGKFWHHKRVLITGSSGYLGRELVRQLSEAGSTVVGWDVASSQVSGRSHTDMITVPLRDVNQAVEVLKDKKITSVFHLAGMSGVRDCEERPAMAFEANAQATWCLLEACRIYGKLSEIITVSSNHIYGDQGVLPVSEEAKLSATASYGASKACADIVAQCYGKHYGLPLGIARITNTFGGDDPHRTHVITGSILAVLRGEAPVVRGDGRSSKGYLYINDTINAFLTLAEKVKALGLAGDAFNFAPSRSVSVHDLVSEIVQLSGERHMRPKLLGRKTGGDEHVEEWLSNRKAARVLGWKPAYSLKAGLTQAIQDIKQAKGKP